MATQKSGSIFTTARLRELSDNYFDAMREYERKQNKLVKEIVGIAGESCATQKTRIDV